MSRPYKYFGNRLVAYAIRIKLFDGGSKGPASVYKCYFSVKSHLDCFDLARAFAQSSSDLEKVESAVLGFADQREQFYPLLTVSDTEEDAYGAENVLSAREYAVSCGQIPEDFQGDLTLEILNNSGGKKEGA